MTSARKHEKHLVGQLLVAMPGMLDPRFAKTVIYICAHNPDGAMGLVVNRVFEQMTFAELLKQLNIEPTERVGKVNVHLGGPVETAQGFVLHSPDYIRDGTLVVAADVALTATIDILKAIVAGTGPRRYLLALGYAGWGPGQLDSEIRANGWLHVAADEELVFGTALDTKWERAMTKIGIDPGMLSDTVGHA